MVINSSAVLSLICCANVTHAPNESSLNCNPDFPRCRYFIIKLGRTGNFSEGELRSSVASKSSFFGISGRRDLNPRPLEPYSILPSLAPFANPSISLASFIIVQSFIIVHQVIRVWTASDVAVMGSVLLHCRDPRRIVEQCGKKAASLVITDMFHPDLEGAPICCLAPIPQNFLWHTWWHFSTQFFTQFLTVMGFNNTKTSTHQQYHRGRAHTLFTIVGQR